MDTEDKMTFGCLGLFGVLWLTGAALTVGFWGLVAWAIYRLVIHFCG